MQTKNLLALYGYLGSEGTKCICPQVCIRPIIDNPESEREKHRVYKAEMVLSAHRQYIVVFLVLVFNFVYFFHQKKKFQHNEEFEI